MNVRMVGQVEQLVREGHAGKAAKVITRGPKTPFDGDLLETLAALHPPGPDKRPSLRTDAPLISWIDIPTLKDVIFSASKGSSPGRSGWTADLLRPLCDDTECIQGLAHLILDILNGRFEGKARCALLGSILIALPKPNGKVRPIAMGETLYKIAGLYALRLVRKEVKTLLGDTQFAMAPGGSESAVQLIMSSLSLRPFWSALSVDITNAFNTRESYYQSTKKIS